MLKCIVGDSLKMDKVKECETIKTPFKLTLDLGHFCLLGITDGKLGIVIFRMPKQ